MSCKHCRPDPTSFRPLPKKEGQLLSAGEIEDLRDDAAEALIGSNLKGLVMHNLDRLLGHYGYLLRANWERIHGDPVTNEEWSRELTRLRSENEALREKVAEHDGEHLELTVVEVKPKGKPAQVFVRREELRKLFAEAGER